MVNTDKFLKFFVHDDVFAPPFFSHGTKVTYIFSKQDTHVTALQQGKNKNNKKVGLPVDQKHAIALN